MCGTPLKGLLLDTLRGTGAITFERYMALCLYHPEYGYYTQGRDRTGVGGDYFTSPDLHPIFARLVARQAAEMWEMLGRPSRFSWVEMGAGRGLFAHDFLDWVKRVLPDFASGLDYAVIEPGPRQCARVRERLAEEGLKERSASSRTSSSLRPSPDAFFQTSWLMPFRLPWSPGQAGI